MTKLTLVKLYSKQKQNAINKLIKRAELEIKEWKGFIKILKKSLNENSTSKNNRNVSRQKMALRK